MFLHFFSHILNFLTSLKRVYCWALSRFFFPGYMTRSDYPRIRIREGQICEGPLYFCIIFRVRGVDVICPGCFLRLYIFTLGHFHWSLFFCALFFLWFFSFVVCVCSVVFDFLSKSEANISCGLSSGTSGILCLSLQVNFLLI